MSCAAVTPFGVTWTPEEDAIVRENYRDKGSAATAAMIPGRSPAAVEHRARAIGAVKWRRWSKEDDRMLWALWGEKSVNNIGKIIGRTPAAICSRAHGLGLPFGVQPGFESIRAAAQRTGFCRTALVNIMKWAQAPINRTVSWCIWPTSYRWLMVDPFDVDTAIEKWMASETVNDAAERRGVTAHRLSRWLRNSNDPSIPPKPEGKGRWRVPSDAIDRVIAEMKRCDTERTNNKA